MLISFCSIAFRESKIEDLIPRVARLGYDGIEIWGNHLGEFHRRNGEMRTLINLLADGRISVPVISPYFSFTEGEEELAVSFQAAREFGFYSKILGNAAVRVFVGPPGSRDATEAQWTAVVEGLQRVCDEHPTVTFYLETHQGQLMDTTASTLEIIRRVGRRNLKVLLDIHNLFAVGEDPVEVLRQLFPHIAHVHVKNLRREKVCYLDEGDMNYLPFISALQSTGYSRYLSVEWFGEEAWSAAKHEISILRSWLRQ
ncbi:MAG: sugar phosphate isomerase/epimerase family protein [Bacteroidota bacterium]